jgi:hypothetical protein
MLKVWGREATASIPTYRGFVSPIGVFISPSERVIEEARGTVSPVWVHQIPSCELDWKEIRNSK